MDYDKYTFCSEQGEDWVTNWKVKEEFNYDYDINNEKTDKQWSDLSIYFVDMIYVEYDEWGEKNTPPSVKE